MIADLLVPPLSFWIRYCTFIWKCSLSVSVLHTLSHNEFFPKWNRNSVYSANSAVAHPGFARGRQPQRGALTYYLTFFLPKTAWKWKQKKLASFMPPPDPPLFRDLLNQWSMNWGQFKGLFCYPSSWQIWIIPLNLNIASLWMRYSVKTVWENSNMVEKLGNSAFPPGWYIINLLTLVHIQFKKL